MPRPDGKPIKNLSMLRRMMPVLMPTRNECIVYFEQELDLSKTLPWLAQHDITFFQLFLAGLVRTFAERPQLNRFVAGRRLYQRNDIVFSATVKKKFEDTGRLTAVKATFEPTATLAEVCDKVNALIGEGKGDKDTQSEKEMRIITRLPPWFMRWLVRFQAFFDRLGLLPGVFTRGDPLYASAFIANLGSIGLEAAYHHLYEWGTIPFFMVIGKIKKGPVVDDKGELSVRDVVHIRYSFDERITDGYYTARSLEIFKRYIENPELLQPARAEAPRPPQPQTAAQA